MKVLLISHMPPPTTGIGSWTRRVLECGISGCAISFVNSNMIGGRDPFQNTKVVLKNEIERSLAIWKQEAQILNKEYCQIVHTNIPCTVLGLLRESVAAMIAKRYGSKFVIHCHCTVPNVVNSSFKKFIFKMVSRLTDGFIVLNKESENFTKEITKKEVAVIPNFVCGYELPETADRVIRNKISDVLFVGGVSADKGCDTIIQAAKKMPDVCFHLVGIVSPEISDMEISENVILYGNKDKDFVRDMMLSSDTFVFLSRYFGEGFSVALVEAMAAGLPCVVTDWAANADMIGSEGGKVIPQMDADALVNALEEMSAHPEKRQAQSRHNMEKVRSSYVERVVIPQYTAFYEKLVNQK